MWYFTIGIRYILCKAVVWESLKQSKKKDFAGKLCWLPYIMTFSSPWFVNLSNLCQKSALAEGGWAEIQVKWRCEGFCFHFAFSILFCAYASGPMSKWQLKPPTNPTKLIKFSNLQDLLIIANWVRILWGMLKWKLHGNCSLIAHILMRFQFSSGKLD